MYTTLPATGWHELDTHTAYTVGVKVQCLQSIISRHVKPGANSIPVFAAMIEDLRNMRANLYNIKDEVICLHFLRPLPKEYSSPSTDFAQKYGFNTTPERGEVVSRGR